MTLIDLAGAQTGGAARFRREAERWAAEQNTSAVQLIGLGHRAEPRWLLRRELIGPRQRRIATNNMSFLSGTGLRILLLRNPLHFLRNGEAQRIPAMPAGVRRQTPIVWASAYRADVIVVPSSEMADRVVRILPRLARRITVRHHPLRARRPSAIEAPHLSSPFILYPSMPAPHKDLIGGIRLLASAISVAQIDLTVIATCDPNDLGEIAHHPNVRAIGTQSLLEMDALWSNASAAYSPYAVESFNYPVAESRAIGIPILAIDTELNREIGAAALTTFRPGDASSLASAIQCALASSVLPDPQPFDPESYFTWLTNL